MDEAKKAGKKPEAEEWKKDADAVEDAASDEPVRPMRGIKLVQEALELEDYPMTKGDIDYSVGDIEVEDGTGGYVPVRILTDRLRRERYDSAEDVMRALQAALASQRGKAA